MAEFVVLNNIRLISRLSSMAMCHRSRFGDSMNMVGEYIMKRHYVCRSSSARYNDQ